MDFHVRRPLVSLDGTLSAFYIVGLLNHTRGETGLGKWSIIVKDTNDNDHTGNFTDWRLTLWGECIDASKQEPLPMPTEHDDDDHDVMTVSVGTATVTHPPVEEPSANPSDHPDRPVNAKPTAPPAISISKGTTSATATPVATAEPAATTSADSYLPHYFPTFGVSKKTQVWIYGAIAIIVLFCAGLGSYFVIQRRRRNRINRDDYEFEMVEEDDVTTGLNGGAHGKRQKRRGGELYDAFAGESDEELLSEEEGYRDEGPNDEEARGRRRSRESDDGKQ